MTFLTEAHLFLKDMNSTFIETIRGPKEIQALTLDLVKSAKEEILGLFSTSNAFHRQERAGSVSAGRTSLEVAWNTGKISDSI